MTREEIWRREYAARPYLTDTSDDDLSKRLRYILENMMALLPTGQIGVLPPEPHGKQWYPLLSHAMEEYKRRGKKPPDGFLSGANVPKPTYPNLPKCVSALARVDLPREGSYLAKFGCHRHMENLHRHGQIKVSPAKCYADPSLNAAIKDDELSVTQFALRSEIQMEGFDHVTGESFGPIEPISNVSIVQESTTDYYVYCMGATTDIRLFADFGYDACVVIREPKDFLVRMFEAMECKFPGWLASSRPVHYYDPYNWRRANIPVVFAKHHRYWYQREYRIAWVPPTNALSSALNPIFLELGPMTGNTELVAL